jgi:hypothetical protein
VETDDFSTFFDYSGGAVGGIWDGSFNMSNLAGGSFFSNMTFVDNTLTVQDNGATNMGWEGNRSSAPFLFSNVPAGQDFTATVKISAQTSGQWSSAGLLARAGNSPTPPGTGANNADENFVSMSSFRTDAANPNSGNTLMKRIQAGAQINDINLDINAGTIPNPTPPPDTLPNPEPLPIWLRLERVGGVGYRGSVSTDGVNFKLQSHTIPAAGNALRDPAVGMQVGLHYQNFGTLSGTSQFDDFVLDTHAPLAAPGAPVIAAAQTAFVVPAGTVIQLPITNSTNQSILEWVRSVNLPGTDGLFPTGLGPAPPVLTPPVIAAPTNGSVFYWNTTGRPFNEMQTINITATNDWGQVSNQLTITVRIIPEPTTAALVGLTMACFVGWTRRRRR